MKLNELVDRPAVSLFEAALPSCYWVSSSSFTWPLSGHFFVFRGVWSDVAGFSGPILMLGLAFGAFRLLLRLRQAIVFPRIGYAALQQNAGWTTRWCLGVWTVAALSAFLWSVPVIPDYPHKTAVMLCILFSGGQIYSGVRYRQPYQIFVGILWIPFGIRVMLAHAGIPVTALMYGSVTAVSGAIRLWRFVVTHPVLTESEA
jgi:hypothetical protein